jgi:hypothetical protein
LTGHIKCISKVILFPLQGACPAFDVTQVDFLSLLRSTKGDDDDEDGLSFLNKMASGKASRSKNETEIRQVQI